MSKPRQTISRQSELFRIPLEKIINPKHELVLLGDKFDWSLIEQYFNQQFSVDKGGQPPLNPRLVVGLCLLKYMDDLSDEAVVKRWVDSPHYQYFCGMSYFEHELPCHPSSLTRWRGRISRGGAERILKETIRIMREENFVSQEEFDKIFIDTTVQEKHIAFPTDAKLFVKARRILVKLAKKEGVCLRQTYEKESKLLLLEYSRKSHAKQYKRAKRSLRRLKTILGRVIRDIRRKSVTFSQRLSWVLRRATLLFNQKKSSKNKIYSMHAPEVRCISKGKAHKRYEFGNKVSIATTAENSIVVGIQSFSENHYDGKTLSDSLFQVKDILGEWPQDAYVDRGYKGYDGYVFGTQVHRQGLKRHSNETKSYLRKRARIEPVISHLKSDHRMGCNRLAGEFGDMMNSLLAGCAFNLRKLGKWLRKAIYMEFLAVISLLMLQIWASLPLILGNFYSKFE